HRRQQNPRETAVGTVEYVEPDLFLDHVDLVDQVLAGQLRRTHPIRFQEQAAFQRSRRQDLEIVGVVRVRGSVEDATAALHVPEVLQLLQAFAALEHQMLEEMRESG